MDLDRQVLFSALGPVASPVTAAVSATSAAEAIASAPQALVAVKRVLWSETAPALLKDKLAAIADKAGSIETRATMVKEALAAVDTRVARTVVGFRMAGGLLQKAAYKAGVARELSTLEPGAESSLKRMAAARQQFVDAQQHAGDAAVALRELAGHASETPWAVQEIRGIQQTAGSAKVELSRTESRGQLLAEMDAGTGLLAEAPSPDAAAAAPAAGPGAEFEFGEKDLARIGSALDPNKPPVQNDWSEQMVNTVCDLGRQQGGVTDEQGGRNFELARTVLATDGATGAKELGAADLAAVLKMSGVDLGKVDPNQLQSAARYVSGATTREEQQDKLRKTIDNFQVLEKIGLPKLSRQQMVDELWGVAKVPAHALAKLSDADVAKKLQEVLGTVNAGPGKSEIKIGKYNLKLEVGQNGTVEKSSCKKPSFFSKIVKIAKIVTPIALTVLSFIPITAPFALAAQGVISMVQAIKAKSLLGIATAAAALAGAGGAIVSKFAGAAAKAAGAASKAAATVAKAAKVMKVANSASRALQGVSSLKSGDFIGGLASIGSGIASGMSSFAGSAAKGLGKFADNLNKVSTKLSAVGAGVASFEGYKKASQALSAAKEALQAAQASGDPRAIAAAQKRFNQAESQKRAAAIGGAVGAATAASAWVENRSLFAGESKATSPAQTPLQSKLRLASQGLRVAQSVAAKDYAVAAAAALSFGSTVASAQKGGKENSLNDAANMAQAGLGYYRAEKGRTSANRSVWDAKARLDTAKRGGNAEQIRQAEAELKKAKGGAESALMGGIAAGESLLGTARDISQQRAQRAATAREAQRLETIEAERETGVLLSQTRNLRASLEEAAENPQLSPEDREKARGLLKRLDASLVSLDQARSKAGQNPKALREFNERLAALQETVAGQMPLVRVASLGIPQPSPGAADLLAGLPPAEVAAFYRRLALDIRTKTGSDSLAAELLLHWLEGKGITKTVSASFLEDVPFVKEYLQDEVRAVFLTDKQAEVKPQPKWGGLIPRILGVPPFDKDPAGGPYSMMYEGPFLEVPLTVQARAALGLPVDKRELDLLMALHKFGLVTEVVVKASPVSPSSKEYNVEFASWRTRMHDYYNWDPSKHLTVPNPDFGSRSPNAVAPDQRAIKVFHSNALRVEQAGLAAPFRVESAWWQVKDPAIVGSAVVNVSRCQPAPGGGVQCR